MYWNKITAHAVDIFAVLLAAPLAVPFILLVCAPFVGGL
jgi:hypothetical protein